MPTITYTTPGSYTFTVPVGVTSIIVEAIGKGGKGGNAININSDGLYAGNVYGGGGGGGGYGKATQPVTPGQNIQIYIPQLDNDPFINYVQVIYGNDGSGYALVMRVNPGGNGGLGVYVDEFDFQIQGPGGSGGSVQFGSTGQTTTLWNFGGNGTTTGGGGGAGTTGNGGNAGYPSYYNAGLGTPVGGGNGGDGASSSPSNGFNGSNYGGGGGGAISYFGAGGMTGGSNGGAWAAITYTEPPPPAVGNSRFFPFF